MKQLFFLILSFFILSCSNQDGSDFVGKWVDKKTEDDLSEIIKNGKTYIASDNSGKYPAEYKDGMLEISSPLGTIKATIDTENGNLLVAGKEYIRIENATRPKFIGKWKESYIENMTNNSKEELVEGGYLNINDTNGNLTILYEGHPGYPQKYNNIKYENGKIIYNLSYGDEYGWNYKNKMEFELTSNGNLKTKHNFDSSYVIFTKEN